MSGSVESAAFARNSSQRFTAGKRRKEPDAAGAGADREGLVRDTIAGMAFAAAFDAAHEGPIAPGAMHAALIAAEREAERQALGLPPKKSQQDVG